MRFCRLSAVAGTDQTRASNPEAVELRIISPEKHSKNTRTAGKPINRIACLRIVMLSGRVETRGRLAGACSAQSSDFISLISLVRLSLASPNSIMHFSL